MRGRISLFIPCPALDVLSKGKGMNSMVWGTVIIVIGLSVLLGAVFGINIPVFKILLGLLLVYMGIKVIFGSFSFNLEMDKRSTDHEAVMSKSQFQYPNSKNSKEYVTVFGNSSLDLTSITDPAPTETLDLVTVFGESVVYVKKGQALRIESNTVLGKAELPGKNISAFGKFEYQTPNLAVTDPALNLKVVAVFGSVRIVEKE